MNIAKIVGIYVGEQEKILPCSVESIEAVANQGLVGDRYYYRQGTFSNAEPESGRHLTLIEQEALEHFQAQTAVELSPAEARRNLITSGIHLNDLVGKQFYVGEVLVAGIRLCDPCSHLQQLTRKQVLTGLANCGGLRADILSSGLIKVGDSIQLVADKN